MKSLILMGFVACVVMPLTWIVDAQQFCQSKFCGVGEKCRLVQNYKTVAMQCLWEHHIEGGSSGCINALPVLEKDGGKYYVRRCGSDRPCSSGFSCSNGNGEDGRVCCPTKPTLLWK